MDPNFACMLAAGILGVTLTAGATNAFAGPRDVVVEGKRKPPERTWASTVKARQWDRLLTATYGPVG